MTNDLNDSATASGQAKPVGEAASATRPTTTLQSMVFPGIDAPSDEALYLRLNDRAFNDLNAGTVCFATGGVLSSDTFFNGLTIEAWKRQSSIDSLFLKLEGHGEFVLTLGRHSFAQASVWLAEHRLKLTPGEATQVPIPEWTALTDGMLFFRLRALGPAALAGGAFETAQTPRNDIRLGIVITHFNRQQQVLPAIDRIRRGVLDRPGLSERTTLTIVDNSRNLAPAPHRSIRHLPNRNLGGTGGFVRGLLSLIDAGDYTHALFMDDDASCEIESIARCVALLQFANDKRLAVAGALLREQAPWELLEKGARFDGEVRPLHAGLDMRRVVDLLQAERRTARPDYGAWWFFGFPIAEVRQFPFPFFVRGDDIFFGLRNRFDIMTLNGIACWGEDFSSKHGPLTAYLDARYHLVHALLAPRGSAARLAWIGKRLFLKALTGYLYSSAHAVTLAIDHTLRGPAFFRDNLDLSEVRSEIAALKPSEKPQPVDRTLLKLKPMRSRHESKGRRLVRVLTLQGFALPGFLLRDRTTIQPKSFHGQASAVFRYRRVLYEHATSGTGFIAEFDRRRFFVELGSFLRVWAIALVRLPALRRAYATGADELGSIDFWRGVYAPECLAAESSRAGHRDTALAQAAAARQSAGVASAASNVAARTNVAPANAALAATGLPMDELARAREAVQR